MIGVRIECDIDDCGRHFELPGDELSPMPAIGTGGFADGRVGVCFVGVATFPAGWAVGEEHPGIVRVLCAAHAQAEAVAAA